VTTFIALVAIGSLPLMVFVLDLLLTGGVSAPFAWSAAMTAMAFFIVGAPKSHVVDEGWLRSGLETLLIGAAAAAVAYVVGDQLRQVAS
jgi:VIT1/CCC1 family predicted Fe2+/Mn2+ transporter